MSIDLRDMINIDMKDKESLGDWKLDKHFNLNFKPTPIHGRGDTKEIRLIPNKASGSVDFKNVNFTDIVQTQLKSNNKPGKCLQRSILTGSDKEIITAKYDHKLNTFTNDTKLRKDPEIAQQIKKLKRNNIQREIQTSTYVDRPKSFNKLLNSIEENENITRDVITDDIKREILKKNFIISPAMKGVLKSFLKSCLSVCTRKKLKLKRLNSSLQCEYRNKLNNVINISGTNNNNNRKLEANINIKEPYSEITPKKYYSKDAVQTKPHCIASKVVKKVDKTMNKNISNNALIDAKGKMSNYFNSDLECYFVHLNINNAKGLCVGVPEKTQTNDLQRHKHCNCRQNSSFEIYKQPSNGDHKSFSKINCNFIRNIKLTFMRIFKRNKIILPSNNMKIIPNNMKPVSGKGELLNCQQSNIRNNTNRVGKISCILQHDKKLDCTCAPIKTITSFNNPNIISKVISITRTITKNSSNPAIQNTDHEKCHETLCEIKIDASNKHILNKREVKRKLKPKKQNKKRCFTKADHNNNLNIDVCNEYQKKKGISCLKNRILPWPSDCKGPVFEVKLDPHNMRILNFPEIMQKIRNFNCQRAELAINSVDRRLLSKNDNNVLDSNSKYLRRVRSKISCLWTQFICKCDSKSHIEKSKFSRNYYVKPCTTCPDRKDTRTDPGTCSTPCKEIGKQKRQKKKCKTCYKNFNTKSLLRVNHKSKKNSTLRMKKLTKKQRTQSRSKRHCKSKINRPRNVLQLFQTMFKIRTSSVYSPSSCNCFKLRRWGLKKDKKQRKKRKEERHNRNSFFLLWCNRKKHDDCGGKRNVHKEEAASEQWKSQKKKRRKRRDQISNYCQYAHLKNTEKPCLWLYIICPSLYPSYLAMKAVLRCICHFMFIIIALVSWFPCFVALEILRVCCYL